MSDAENNNKPENNEQETNAQEATASNEPKQDVENNPLQAELEKVKKDHLYLLAEYDNYKKQVIRDRSHLMKYANENVLRDVISVMDNFSLALQNEVTAENIEGFVTGVKMIEKEMLNTVEKYGAVKLQSLGEKFDPSVHEALGTEPAGEHASGHVSKVFKEGYKLHDRLLRPAQVIIASEAADETSDNTSEKKDN